LIKFRSDIFLTNISIDVLLTEIENVINNQCDIVFLGTNIHNDYDQTYKRYEDARTCARINDFIIIARKSCLPKFEEVYDTLKKESDNASGNVHFHQIIKPNVKAINVSTQIYLIRKNYSEPLDIWRLYYGWAESYMYKATAQHNWIRDNKEIIRAF